MKNGFRMAMILSVVVGCVDDPNTSNQSSGVESVYSCTQTPTSPYEALYWIFEKTGSFTSIGQVQDCSLNKSEGKYTILRDTVHFENILKYERTACSESFKASSQQPSGLKLSLPLMSDSSFSLSTEEKCTLMPISEKPQVQSLLEIK